MSSLLWTEGERLKPLERVLRRWRRLVRDHPRRFHDTLVWNRERPQVGFLAAATWLSSGAAIEEYRTAKRGMTGGRTDLYLCIGQRHFAFEAKHRWLDVSSVGDVDRRALKCLRSLMRRASEAARRGPRSEGVLAAPVFVSPYTRSKGDLAPGHRALHRAVERNREELGLDFVAWTEAEPMRWPPQGTNLAWHGGVLLMGSIVG